jgi:hypothetical protein
VGLVPRQLPRGQGPSQMLTGSTTTIARRLCAGDRRRRPISGSRGALCTPLARGHYEKSIGNNPTTEWSPELAPVRTSAAAHSGRTTIPSYGTWIYSKTIWEGAYAHPEADANLTDVGDGRRWVNHHEFRQASAEGNGKIWPIWDTSTRFLA